MITDRHFIKRIPSTVGIRFKNKSNNIEDYRPWVETVV